MIHLRGVSKQFGTRPVLRGVDADIATGRVTGLVGPNGAGKTTLIKLLLGLAIPDSGAISVGTHLLDGTPEYRARIGYMPQMVRFPANLSGRDLFESLSALRGDMVEPELSLLHAFDLTTDFARPLGVLSGGTRQKVNAVLAFAFRPELLILDEPTVGLDPLAARVLKDRIHLERAKGATIVVTSHVLPELEELADDLLFLADGAMRWQGEVRQLTQSTGHASLERAVAALLSGQLLQAVA